MNKPTFKRPAFSAMACAACGISSGSVAYAARDSAQAVIVCVIVVCGVFILGCLAGGIDE